MVPHQHTETPPPSALPYSPIVIRNGFAFSAGQTPHDPDTDQVSGNTIEEQTVQTLRNVTAVLASRGLSPADVVKVNVYLANIERDFSGFNTIYQQWFSKPYPARTTIGAKLDGFLIEVDCVGTVS
ncbi:RidA family protein [Subtercola lobariae]|uniref:Reactive intermediate/imine deaminase n=1 Tax=Subtercola lobariae TaxID=1588641 RepID=A0A917B4X7_9MICO|nr:RidA family protein [Subtercola lobariae]GGF19237.1 reactive intermediate/imine deaminase [Subtercola lobariae]